MKGVVKSKNSKKWEIFNVSKNIYFTIEAVTALVNYTAFDKDFWVYEERTKSIITSQYSHFLQNKVFEQQNLCDSE